MAAIEQLGRLRMPEALSALDTLALTLPPTFSTLAERSARKLRIERRTRAELPGVLDVASWRALISPVDGTGVQVTWLVSHTPGQETGSLLTVANARP